MGTDPKDNSYHDNSPGISDLFAADTDAANNRWSTCDYVQHQKQNGTQRTDYKHLN